MNKKRIYLDYNATSPLCKKSLDFLNSGDFYFANPASQHQSGKAVNRKIKHIQTELLSFFTLKNNFKTIFHSGATEAMNMFFNLEAGDCLVYASTDHSLVSSIAEKLKKSGVEIIVLPVNNMGMLDTDQAIEQINTRKSRGTCWMNYTWMNNETGVVWDLKTAEKLKQSCDIFIHVDAVQTPGKIENYQSLSEELDCYSYSGHKFGAFKGVGFSFLKNTIPVKTLIHGGGQQEGLRSGTINSYGLYSLLPALNSLNQKNYNEVQKNKRELEAILGRSPNIEYILNESNNTICFIHKKLKADVLFIHFDMAGFDVSMGSACSSGSIEKSHVLEAMGYKELSSNSIRVSLGIQSLDENLELIKRFSALIGKL